MSEDSLYTNAASIATWLRDIPQHLQDPNLPQSPQCRSADNSLGILSPPVSSERNRLSPCHNFGDILSIPDFAMPTPEKPHPPKKRPLSTQDDSSHEQAQLQRTPSKRLRGTASSQGEATPTTTRLETPRSQTPRSQMGATSTIAGSQKDSAILASLNIPVEFVELDIVKDKLDKTIKSLVVHIQEVQAGLRKYIPRQLIETAKLHSLIESFDNLTCDEDPSDKVSRSEYDIIKEALKRAVTNAKRAELREGHEVNWMDIAKTIFSAVTKANPMVEVVDVSSHNLPLAMIKGPYCGWEERKSRRPDLAVVAVESTLPVPKKPESTLRSSQDILQSCIDLASVYTAVHHKTLCLNVFITHNRFLPCFMVIEVKSENHTSGPARSQLAFAAYSQISALSRWCVDKMPMEQLCVAVQGHKWSLFIAKVVENEVDEALEERYPSTRRAIKMYNVGQIGTTEDGVGVCRLWHNLDRCMEWSTTHYLKWINKAILRAEETGKVDFKALDKIANGKEESTLES